MSKITLEICCGSLEDTKAAQAGGADRIELNSALYLGGLTPSLGTLLLAKEQCTIPVVAMVRPRGGGFCYSEDEFEVMLRDTRILLEHGADGIVFGFLHSNNTLDVERSSQMVELIHSYGKEAVFHRAIDCMDDIDSGLEQLIALKVDRVLTSGGRNTAWEGREVIARLQQKYGNQIEILPGAGLRKENALDFLTIAGTTQVHSSCKGYHTDPTAKGVHVSYAYNTGEHEMDVEVVNLEEVVALRNLL